MPGTHGCPHALTNTTRGTKHAAGCRYELASDRTVAGGFVTRITHGGHILPWQTAHHLLKTFYMPLLMRPRGFAQGLRCVLGALPCRYRSAPAPCPCLVPPVHVGLLQRRWVQCRGSMKAYSAMCGPSAGAGGRTHAAHACMQDVLRRGGVCWRLVLRRLLRVACVCGADVPFWYCTCYLALRCRLGNTHGCMRFCAVRSLHPRM